MIEMARRLMCDKFSVLCTMAELNAKQLREDDTMSEDKTCWSCGHYLIGGGCWKDGDFGEDGWRNVGPDDSCEGWVEENTPGTINGAMYEMHSKEEKE
jgi:hypothetical protein